MVSVEKYNFYTVWTEIKYALDGEEQPKVFMEQLAQVVLPRLTIGSHSLNWQIYSND